MSFSSSFRDKPRLSDRLRGKSGDELFNELRKEFDQDSKSFFNRSPTSNSGSTTGSTFPRAGHLFEEPSMRRHFDIKSHLEDLAHRHPEFADQLHYPAWSNDSHSNSWGRKRRGSGQPEPGEASKQHQQETPQQQQQEQQSESEEQAPPRGRVKENLRNTVPDMGQKQQQEAEDKESRGQRSWSAPPDNRQQQEKPRFVSKIEITPVNPDAPQTQTGDATKPPMAPPKPQPQPQQQPQSQSQPKSTVRHIPIFVEGRDEPVIPKNVEPEFTQSQAPPQQQYSRPPPQPQHHQFQQQTPQRKQTPPQFEQYAAPPSYQHPPPPQPEPEPQQQEPPPTVNPRDPFYVVACVQKEVDELRAQIDSFSGNSRTDKQYILLDELLTRNLIKLDNVETEGKEELRALRKNAIRTIQSCISFLESKVPVPSSGNAEGGENNQDAQQNPDTVGTTGEDQLQQNVAEHQQSTNKSSSVSHMDVVNEQSQETNTSGASMEEDKKSDVDNKSA